MIWHVEPKLLDAYVHGDARDSRAYSIEAHLLSCESCRAQLAIRIDHGRLNALWARVEDTVRAPTPGPVERLLVALGVKDHTARLLGATRSLSLSWFLAIALALAFAVVAAHTGNRGFVLFLVVAPLLPLAGVAAAYGPGVDPTYEIGLTSPLSSFRLLLIRAVSVLATTVLLGAAAALAMPELNWTAVAWLLPSLGLVAASLALATYVTPILAASIVAGAWIAVALVVTLSAQTLGELRSVFAGSLQVVLVTVTLVSGTALLLRRDSFEQGERP